jgi:hypothetical protein
MKPMLSFQYKKTTNFLSINDLFALTIAIMIGGHMAYFFSDGNLWLRIFDRMTIPVLLISVGYNLGHKITWPIYWGFILIFLGSLFVPYGSPINILGVFMLIKLFLHPLIIFLSRSKILFWGAYSIIAFISPFTDLLFEYGSVAVVLATAGWIIRNQDDIRHITTPAHFMIFAFFSHLWFTQILFEFSQTQLICVAIGSAFIMWLLLDYKTLILTSLKRRPRDLIEKTCALLAHKSLEIYVLHLLVFMIIYYLATTPPLLEL